MKKNSIASLQNIGEFDNKKNFIKKNFFRITFVLDLMCIVIMYVMLGICVSGGRISNLSYTLWLYKTYW